MTTDHRTDILTWIDERLAECERATGEPWSFSGQRGRPGSALLAQVWRPDGDSLATLDATEDGQATANALFIASSRTVLPLVLLAMRAEVEAHQEMTHYGQPGTGLCHECCVERDHAPMAGYWPCETLRRIHSNLGLGKEGEK